MKDNTIWVCSSWWYQNIEKHIVPYEFDKEYSADKYPKYDDCDAIEVSRYKDIPKDYDGVMGVPISSLKAIDASVFDILDYGSYYLQGKRTFKRLLVKRKA